MKAEKEKQLCKTFINKNERGQGEKEKSFEDNLSYEWKQKI